MAYGRTHAPDAAERQAQHRRRMRLVERRQCADPKRRLRNEKNTPKWLRFYMGGAFPYPWSDGHMETIHNAEQAAITGTGTAVAAPRGDGKTTCLRGVAINLVARGIVSFPVLAGWKHMDATAAYQSWLRMLCESPQFAADYPEYTQPFEISTHKTALKQLAWADTEKHIGALVDSMLKIIILPDSQGAIAARSVQGDVKGLNATLIDGTVLRPDLLLLDDAQNPKQAENPKSVLKTIDTIENEFMGMAGPQKRLTTFCACTVEGEHDVSSHFLARRGWTSARVSRILTWPAGGEGGDWPAEKDDVQREMWDEWYRVLLDEGEPAARKMYRREKKAMTAGMAVSWKHRFDKERGEPDALYSAMFDYYSKGADVFARSQQNIPIKQGVSVYELTPEIIMSRVDRNRAAYEVPTWGQIAVAATDINHYGLHTAALSFANDQTAAVTYYDRYDAQTVPDNAPEQKRRQIIFSMLVNHMDQIAALPNVPPLWIIDGGYEHGTVQKFAQTYTQLRGMRIVVARGYSAERYRPHGKNVIGQAREECHATQWPLGKGLAWNADYWREIAQRAWLGEVGAPGSCSLFRGHHQEFAQQICRERLGEKLAGKMGMVWRWIQTPGWHDYGDCMAMAYAGAAWAGIGTGGESQPKPKPRRRRSARHVRI
jgi:hypothetical protein